MSARILAVADAFEAIQVPNVLDRVLRDHITLRILPVASGTQLGPTVVTTLSAAMTESRAEELSSANWRRECPGTASDVGGSPLLRPDRPSPQDKIF
ncbi:MAG: hypothetical protein FJ244_04005 [Nitrospira sp.]|nr:hypothetical protein [Nitrospira sp.]